MVKKWKTADTSLSLCSCDKLSALLNEKMCGQKISDPMKQIDKIKNVPSKIIDSKVGEVASINYLFRGFTL